MQQGSRTMSSRPADPATSAGVLAEAEALKNTGNEAFGKGDFASAISCYKKAFLKLSSLKNRTPGLWASMGGPKPLTGDEYRAYKQALVNLHTNLSFAYLRQEKWELCVSAARRAIQEGVEAVEHTGVITGGALGSASPGGAPLPCPPEAGHTYENPKSYLRLAQALKELGQKEEAELTLTKAQEYFRNQPAAREAFSKELEKKS